jgi:hypothetical protein
MDECAYHNPNFRVGAEPLYLTLPGSQGLDIKLLIETGLIDSTEVGGIALHHLQKVVAVESGPQAVEHLQGEIPGLWILETNVKNLIRGHSPLTWPDTADERRACRSLVVNLDFNASVGEPEGEHSLDLPVLKTIAKIVQMHAIDPAVPEWTLLLTLNSFTAWQAQTWVALISVIHENLREVPSFRSAALTFLGPQIVSDIESGVDPGPTVPAHNDLRRSLLMAFIPKRVADVARLHGWAVDIRRNVAYPGGGPETTMLSWVIRFRWDQRAAEAPIETYRASVATVLAHVELLA